MDTVTSDEDPCIVRPACGAQLLGERSILEPAL
jgi:hypothetical protein